MHIELPHLPAFTVAGITFDMSITKHVVFLWVAAILLITAATIVVHGADDRLVPIAHSRHTAASIPGAERRELPGVGHLSLGRHLPELVAEVTAR